MAITSSSQYLARRPAILGLVKVLLLAIAQLPFVRAVPIHASSFLFTSDNDEGKYPEDPSLWLYLTVAAILVLLGGAFAGLTIALMGQVRRPPLSRTNVHLTRYRMKYTSR
jgi:metal transporter CNNM